jgi:hypothetical protein
MNSRRFMVTFAVAAAILAAVFLLRRPSQNLREENLSQQAGQVETGVQSLLAAEASATQNLTLEEREKRTDQIVRELNSPSLLERRQELIKARREFGQTSSHYEELNQKYSNRLLESSNPETDADLQSKFREAQAELNRLREQSELLNQLTTKFNDELLAKAVSKYAPAAQAKPATASQGSAI